MKLSFSLQTWACVCSMVLIQMTDYCYVCPLLCNHWRASHICMKCKPVSDSWFSRGVSRNKWDNTAEFVCLDGRVQVSANFQISENYRFAVLTYFAVRRDDIKTRKQCWSNTYCSSDMRPESIPLFFGSHPWLVMPYHMIQHLLRVKIAFCQMPERLDFISLSESSCRAHAVSSWKNALQMLFALGAIDTNTLFMQGHNQAWARNRSRKGNRERERVRERGRETWGRISSLVVNVSESFVNSPWKNKCSGFVLDYFRKCAFLCKHASIWKGQFLDRNKTIIPSKKYLIWY